MSKVHLRLLVIALLLPLTNTLFAQERDAGQMVVPTKYVDKDSLRLMLIDMWGSSNVSTGGRHEVDSLADVVQATWEGSCNC
jgi:hypothetical protein